ncbi:hypothetical protein ACJJTC_004261 [Scirpophaga incertulas]
MDIKVIKAVFDYDWGLQDDFMGSCHLDLTALELGRTQDLVLCLRDPSKLGQDLGEIVLNATLWPKTQEDKEQLRLEVAAIFDRPRTSFLGFAGISGKLNIFAQSKASTMQLAPLFFMKSTL